MRRGQGAFPSFLEGAFIEAERGRRDYLWLSAHFPYLFRRDIH